MNPSKPTQAVVRPTKGLSSMAPTFSPSFARKEIMVNMRKNKVEKPIDTAMNTGVVAVGAERRSGTP